MNAEPAAEPVDVTAAFNSLSGRSQVHFATYKEMFDPSLPPPPKISGAERKRIQAERERREEQERDEYFNELARHAFESKHHGRASDITFDDLLPDVKQFWLSIVRAVVAKLDNDGRYSEDGWW